MLDIEHAITGLQARCYATSENEESDPGDQEGVAPIVEPSGAASIEFI
jgi:hypothetical protein